ncbi:MAG: flagellar basal body L-ring protein FlgH [Magnetococcus sp. WYHC-3]
MRGSMSMLLAVASVALLSGCGMTRAVHRPPNPVTPVVAESPDSLRPNKGSIWTSTERNALFQDNKARRVGDLLTVNILETSNASKSAKTELSRKTESDMSLGTMFGLTDAVKTVDGMGRFNPSAAMTGENDFTGDGSTERSSTLTATISCMVIEVLPNGYLRIEGRRDITLNNENQYIVLSGVVRPEDITAANTIQSTQIADARIEMSGDGSIDDQQRPSWFYELLSTVRVL